VDDPRGADLPERRLFRVVLAGLAGGVDALVEDEGLAVGALGARRGEAGLVGIQDAQRIDEAVAEIVGQVEAVAGDDGAVGLGDAGIAARDDALAGPIIHDLVGLDRAALIQNLDVADGRNGVVVLVIDEFARIDDHPLLRLGRCGFGVGAGRLGTGRFGGSRLRNGDATGPST
jgi:hypothetical protein